MQLQKLMLMFYCCERRSHWSEYLKLAKTLWLPIGHSTRTFCCLFTIFLPTYIVSFFGHSCFYEFNFHTSCCKARRFVLIHFLGHFYIYSQENYFFLLARTREHSLFLLVKARSTSSSYWSELVLKQFLFFLTDKDGRAALFESSWCNILYFCMSSSLLHRSLCSVFLNDLSFPIVWVILSYFNLSLQRQCK